jgi:hypothetical protein
MNKLRRLSLLLLGIGMGILLVGCQGLPTYSQLNVPRQAFVGVVPVSVEVDPQQAQLQEVIFSFWQGNGGNGQQFRLNCVAMSDGSRQLCQGDIPFNSTGVYTYEFSTKGRVAGEATTVKTRNGRITIVAQDNPTDGGNNDDNDPSSGINQVAPILVTPEMDATCVGRLSGNRTTVNFQWQAVPGTRSENGAYQIEFHRLSSKCQAVIWTGVGRGFDDYPNCWIADQNVNEHVENLDQGTEYCWRVRASRNTGNGGEMFSGPFSGFQRFKTAAPPSQPPTFVFPTQGNVLVFGEHIVGDTLNVKWSQAECLPESYRLELVNRATNS